MTLDWSWAQRRVEALCQAHRMGPDALRGFAEVFARLEDQHESELQALAAERDEVVAALADALKLRQAEPQTRQEEAQAVIRQCTEVLSRPRAESSPHFAELCGELLRARRAACKEAALQHAREVREAERLRRAFFAKGVLRSAEELADKADRHAEAQMRKDQASPNSLNAADLLAELDTPQADAEVMKVRRGLYARPAQDYARLENRRDDDPGRPAHGPGPPVQDRSPPALDHGHADRQPRGGLLEREPHPAPPPRARRGSTEVASDWERFVWRGLRLLQQQAFDDLRRKHAAVDRNRSKRRPKQAPEGERRSMEHYEPQYEDPRRVPSNRPYEYSHGGPARRGSPYG